LKKRYKPIINYVKNQSKELGNTTNVAIWNQSGISAEQDELTKHCI